VNSPLLDADGGSVRVPSRVNLLTGEPAVGSRLQIARPDAVRFSNRLILDDKPLGRALSKDKQEIIRFIDAYRSSQGQLPNTIAIQRYNPVTGQPVVTELYKPSDFLPKGP
jgi:filamentous hemagglutinin